MDPNACEPDWVDVRDQIASPPQRRHPSPLLGAPAEAAVDGGNTTDVLPGANVGEQHSVLSTPTTCTECSPQQGAQFTEVVSSYCQDMRYIADSLNQHNGNDIAAKLDRQTCAISKLLHRLNLRPFHVRDLTVCAVDPSSFHVPIVNTTTVKACLCDTMATVQSIKAAFDKELKCIINQYAQDCPTKFSKLDLHEQVFLQGHYHQDGPFLWGQIDDGRWVLLCVVLWPQRFRSCWSYLCPMCQNGPLGTIDMVQDGLGCRRQALRVLGPNPYRGYCALPHCI